MTDATLPADNARIAGERHSVAGLRALGCILSILAVAMCLLLNLDPAADGFGYLGNQVVKYTPSLMLLVAAITFVVGGTPTRVHHSGVFWAAVLLCSLQIAGALSTLQTRQVDISATFLGRGFAATAIFAGLICGSDWKLRDAALRPIGRVAVLSAWVGAAMSVLHGAGLIFTDLQQVFHEELLFICAGLLLWAARKPLPVAGIVAFLILAFIAVASGKATAQLLALLLFAILFVAPPFVAAVDRLRSKPASNPLALYVLALLSALFVALTIQFILGLIEAKDFARPNDLRKMLWALRWDQFTNSPIFGSLFVGSPVVSVPQLPGVQIPTHNDILDLLAFGGIIGIALFLALFLPNLQSAEFWSAFRLPQRTRTYLHYPVFVLVVYLGVATANPVFANPFLSVPAWFAIGVINGNRLARKTSAPVNSMASP